MVDVAAHLGCDLAALRDVHLIPRVGEDNVLVSFDRQERATPTPFYKAVAEAARDCGAKTVVFDSQHDLFGGNEVSRVQARTFIGYLRRLALAIDGAVILTAHPSVAGMATGTGTSGSTAWSNAVRSRLYLTRPEYELADDSIRILKTMKQNYGARRDGIELRWENGVFIRTASVTSDPFGEASAAFLDCLDLLTGQGRFVSPSVNSATYAPKIFVRLPQARRCDLHRLQRAMETLFLTKQICLTQHKKPNRHLVEVIARAAQ